MAGGDAADPVYLDKIEIEQKRETTMAEQSIGQQLKGAKAGLAKREIPKSSDPDPRSTFLRPDR